MRFLTILSINIRRVNLGGSMVITVILNR